MNNNYSYPPPRPPMGYAPPPWHQYEPYRKPLRRSGGIVGGGLLMLNGVMLLASFLLYGLFSYVADFSEIGAHTYSLVDQSLSLVIYILGFWIPTLFIVAKIDIPAPAAFPMRRPKASLWIPAVFVTLGTSIIGSTLATILSQMLETVVGVAPYVPMSPDPEGIAANIVYVVSVAIAPAIFEELLFRGVILQSLRRFGDGFALVMSALLFSMAHGNLLQSVNTMLVGLVIGYFVLRTGSVLTGMIIHFFNNGLIVLYGYLEEWLAPAVADSLNLWVYGAYLLLGAGSLLYLFVRDGGLFRLTSSDYPLPWGQKLKAVFVNPAMILFIIVTVVSVLINFA